ncbi:MAG: LacI family DNA-binding transcriptional regulator [Beijerinckiaceae bacterium]|jgi:LacI family transcriptional regulator|nr:LacI family DNA-binding transcriptional regulator [Beijerinckiaceae bacterium]
MKQRTKSITLKDVAAAANVSVGMASRVLGSYGSYSEKTRKSVLKAAKQLNYRVNGIARSLRLKRTQTIGVMVSEIASYHWTVFVQGVEEAAHLAGYNVFICNTADSPAREKEYLSELRKRGVDGIIVSPLTENISLFSDVAETGFPIVLINCKINNRNIPSIRSDDRQAACDAVVYLNSIGHERIGIVAGSQLIETGQNRLGGYRQGHELTNLYFNEELIAYGNYDKQKAYDATQKLITGKVLPTAIIVCSEIMMGSALQCLKHHNINIPLDLSLIGFDDPDWVDFFQPGITTLKEQRFLMGSLASDTVIAIIEANLDNEKIRKDILLRTELIIRDSCAAPKKESLKQSL